MRKDFGFKTQVCNITKKPFLKVLSLKNGLFLVGVTGFEPVASCSQKYFTTSFC